MAKTQSFWSQDVGKNWCLNGNFDIWQRGTSFLYTDTYSADRWGLHQFQNSVRTRQSFVAGGEHDGNSQYVMRVSGNNTNSMRLNVGQGVELLNTIPLRGKKVTLSFLVRFSAASWSINPTSFYAFLGYRTGTADVAFNSNSYSDTASNVTINQGSFPTTWKKYTTTLDIPITATNISVLFQVPNLIISPTTDWYEISQVKLEVGASATPFSLAGGSIGNEILLAQRYYESAIFNVGLGIAGNNAAVQCSCPYKVQKRVSPSVVIYNGTANLIRESETGNSIAVTGYGGNVNGINFILATVTAGRHYEFGYTADSEL